MAAAVSEAMEGMVFRTAGFGGGGGGGGGYSGNGGAGYGEAGGGGAAAEMGETVVPQQIVLEAAAEVQRRLSAPMEDPAMETVEPVC